MHTVKVEQRTRLPSFQTGSQHQKKKKNLMSAEKSATDTCWQKQPSLTVNLYLPKTSERTKLAQFTPPAASPAAVAVVVWLVICWGTVAGALVFWGCACSSGGGGGGGAGDSMTTVGTYLALLTNFWSWACSWSLTCSCETKVKTNENLCNLCLHYLVVIQKPSCTCFTFNLVGASFLHTFYVGSFCM